MHTTDLTPPKPILIAVGSLLISIIGVTAFGGHTGVGVPIAQAEITTERIEIIFLDEADGGLGAYDPETGLQVFYLKSGDGGFMRTALRSLSLDRRKSGFGPMPAFELRKSVAGNIVLIDPTTDNSITLGAFGSANQDDFVELFDAYDERISP